ncbi:MAG: bifunctional folylpolyglutamate synthase/dihydrofolate synthase, partial [Gammaproteobacteria bacterium]|nr:bifunctional folylpolyglutamate synthase/dihydrofolate synthase [Gammaproteobacteria bacterium]
NAATAIAAVRLLLGPGADLAALAHVARVACLPGRFDRRRFRGRELILDVAHNPHGAGFLADQLRAAPCGGSTIAVMGCLKDKDASGIVAALDGVVKEWIFVTTLTPRGQSGEDLFARLTIASGMAGGSLESGIIMAMERAGAIDRIVVLGSFDVVERASAIVDGCVGDSAS